MLGDAVDEGVARSCVLHEGRRWMEACMKESYREVRRKGDIVGVKI